MAIRSGLTTMAAAPRGTSPFASACTRAPSAVQVAVEPETSVTSASKMLAEPRKPATYAVAGRA